MNDQNNQLSAKLQNKGASATVPALKAQGQQWLAENEKRLVTLMGSRKDATRLYLLCMEAASKNPKLLECGNSLFRAVLKCAEFGLYPDPLHEVALVPIWNGKLQRNVCEVWLQYQGWIKLLYNSGFVKNVTAEVVWEGDIFDWELGSNERIFHKPCPVEDRGERLAAYAIIEFMNGAKKHKVLSADQINSYKAMTKASDSNFSPWNSKNPYVVDWMWCAKAVKQAAKLAPRSIQLASAMGYDDAIEIGKDEPESLLDLTSGIEPMGELEQPKAIAGGKPSMDKRTLAAAPKEAESDWEKEADAEAAALDSKRFDVR